MKVNLKLLFRSRRSGTIFEFAAIALIVLLGAYLRFDGIRFGFPQTVRPDEEYFANVVRQMDAGDLNPHFFYYPTGYFYVNLCVFRAYILGRVFTKTYPVLPHGRGIQAILNKNPTLLYFMGRCVGAIFGTLSIIMIYLIGRRFFSRPAALAAAFLIAVNSIHALNSHFYKSDVATSFFVLLSLYLMLDYVESYKTSRLIWAAVVGGVAFSMNYYGGFLLMPLLAAMFFAAKRHGKSLWQPFTNLYLYAAPFLLVAVFLLLSPYVFIDFHKFLGHFHRMLYNDRIDLYNTLVGRGFKAHHFQQPLIYSLEFCLRYSMGLLPALLTLAGIIYFLVKPHYKNFIILIYVFTHFFLVATGKAVFTRYYIPLIPPFCLIVALFLTDIIGKLFRNHRTLGGVIIAVITLISGAEGLMNSISQSCLLTKKDTRVLMGEWMRKNLPLGTKIAVRSDYWYGKPNLSIFLPGARYVTLPSRLDKLPSGVRYILTDTHDLFLYSPDPDKSLLNQINKRTEKVIESHGIKKGCEKHAIYDQLDAFYLPIAKFNGVMRPGPNLALYKLKTMPHPSRKSSGGDKSYIPGLTGRYYTTTNLTGKSRRRIAPHIDFDWGGRSPLHGIPPDKFSVLWEGELFAPQDTLYTFYLASDDGSRLRIDDDIIIDNWKIHAPTEVQASRFLKSGWHPIKITYYEKNFGASIRLSWTYAGLPKRIIPRENFRCRTQALKNVLP